MIAFIPDSVNQALQKMTCTYVAMVYSSNTSMNSVYSFWTLLCTEIRTIIAWPLATNRFTCTTNGQEVSSAFPSGLIIVMMTILGVQVSICGDYHCGSYLPDILLWNIRNGNERQVFAWRDQSNIDCPHWDNHPSLSVDRENSRD